MVSLAGIRTARKKVAIPVAVQYALAYAAWVAWAIPVAWLM
jgi:hypothetical protein